MPAQLLEGDHAGIVYCSTTKQVDETAEAEMGKLTGGLNIPGL